MTELLKTVSLANFSNFLPEQIVPHFSFLDNSWLSVKAKVLWSGPPFHLHHLGLLHRLHPRPGQGCSSYRPVDLRDQLGLLVLVLPRGGCGRWWKYSVDTCGYIVTYNTVLLGSRPDKLLNLRTMFCNRFSTRKLQPNYKIYKHTNVTSVFTLSPLFVFHYS